MIKRSGFAVNAVMGKVFLVGVLYVVWVITLGMLPGLA
jgi:hypothetical protein